MSIVWDWVLILFGAVSHSGLNPARLAYNSMSASWLTRSTASPFNQVDRYASIPGSGPSVTQVLHWYA